MKSPRFRKRQFYIIPAACLLAAFSIAGLITGRDILTFLPGTQPGSVDPMEDFRTCRSCHQSSSPTRPVSITRDWSGSMMAQSTRDPLFHAALAVTNKYNNSAGEWCIRCHSPGGWLAGHSKVPTGQDLTGTDFDGVQCDYCHRAGDQMSPDSLIPPLTFAIPGRGNGMHVVQQYANPKRGPYDSLNAPHETRYTSYLRSSELCATCHDISNPFYATDRLTQPPHTYSPIERTYSEWLLSWYAEQGENGTCQSCHMQKMTGYATSLPSFPLRSDLGRHDLTGGNTFVQDILPMFWTGLDTVALQESKLRATTMLRNASRLEASARRETSAVVASVTITNLTGHKLPTGYSEGRRMWINIVGRDSGGSVIFESGAYLADSGKLVFDNQIKVYETIHGLSDSVALLHGLTPGASFHFGLNDTVLFDNRIPPKGFVNSRFRERLAEPIGATYADSQYWDTTPYIAPRRTATMIIRLLYQTTSKEYVEFLRDENAGNVYDVGQYGQRLYDAWSATGRSAPVVMAETTVAVADGILDVRHREDGAYGSFRLDQNFPNPFNPATILSYHLSVAGRVKVEVYDLLGKTVAVLRDELQAPGSYRCTWDASGAPGGLYFCRVTVTDSFSPTITRSRTIKLLLLR